LIAPSFVEAVAGHRNANPDPKPVALAEELLVRLELDGVAVRLNLLGLPGEQPDFVVASWVLPYVYALRGDRDWRRNPQLTGSRQVSQLAVQTYKLLEAGDATIPTLKHALGREVTEGAVLRAITELWQQLRIIPVLSAPSETAQWQLLRTRYQKAIAEGASTSQVTAISVLASIYLQAVIAASMEEVELFLAPLTARSKVREVLRGLVATRQVHTISLGHAPHFYVAGTLPEFDVAPTLYTSFSMPASAYFMHTLGHEEELIEIHAQEAEPEAAAPTIAGHNTSEPHTVRTPAAHKAATGGKAAAARPHFSRPATASRDRKPAQTSSGGRTARRANPEARPSGSRTGSARWTPAAPTGVGGARKPGNGSSGGNGSNGLNNGTRSGSKSSRPANGSSGVRSGKSSAPAWGQRNGHGSGAKATGQASGTTRSSSVPRNGSAPRKASAPRKDTRSNGHKPALAAGTKAGNSKQFNFTARPKQGTKKRG
jgi:uncharacterized membrane protein YgcG